MNKEEKTEETSNCDITHSQYGWTELLSQARLQCFGAASLSRPASYTNEMYILYTHLVLHGVCSKVVHAAMALRPYTSRWWKVMGPTHPH